MTTARSEQGESKGEGQQLPAPEEAGQLPVALSARALRLSRGNRERAEEIEQRVRVRVWEATTNRPEQIKSLGAFRQGVLVNVHRELSREAKRNQHLDVHTLGITTADSRRPQVAAQEPDPGVLAERSEIYRLVRKAIDSLTRTTQMVVRMRYFDDLQQRQIAEAMGVNEVRVCRILKRARDRLRAMLV